MSFRCEAGSSDDTLKRFDYIISFASSSVGKPWAGGPEMREVCQVLHTAKADFDKKPMIMFVGAFSAGKSTLINTLLGQKLCDTGIKPTTSDLHFYNWHGHLLVDSTGLDNWNQPEHKQKALEAARRSNRAVVVISARQPIGEREIPILKQLVESQSKITMAINYWNHVETEEERSECMTYVQDCLEEIMPGLPVEVIPMDARNGSDPGVQKLSEFLRSTDDSHQKKVSANAAMRIAAQRILDMCTAFETKETQDPNLKIQWLDRDIHYLQRAVENSNELRLRDSEDLRTEMRKLQDLKDQLLELEGTTIWGNAIQCAAAGLQVSTMAAASGAVIGAAQGFSDKRKSGILREQIEEKTRYIQHLSHVTWNAPITTEGRELESKVNERNNEIAIYTKKMGELAADRAQIQAFL